MATTTTKRLVRVLIKLAENDQLTPKQRLEATAQLLEIRRESNGKLHALPGPEPAAPNNVLGTR